MTTMELWLVNLVALACICSMAVYAISASF